MSSRDYINEIVNIRERRRSNNAHWESLLRLESIKSAFNDISQDHISDVFHGNNELLKYFPIALVATMESCFRVIISKLIDNNESFFNNCEPLFKNHKITFEILTGFQGKKISVGKFVSHIVAINKLSDINKLISTITDTNSQEELKTQRSRWDVEIEKKKDEPIISEPDVIYKFVNRTFELRHIFCHESATNVDYTYSEINNCIDSVTIFVNTSIEFVNGLWYPDSPLTQAAMNQVSYKVYVVIKEEILDTIKQLKQNLTYQPDRMKILDSTYEKWLEYMKEYSKFISEEYHGGSIQTLINKTTSTKLSKSFLQLLTNELEDMEAEID